METVNLLNKEEGLMVCDSITCIRYFHNPYGENSAYLYLKLCFVFYFVDLFSLA